MRALKPFVFLVAVWVVISIGGSVITGLIIKSGIDAQQHRLNVAGEKLFNGQVAGCVRSDIQAVKDNRSQFADWTVDQLFVASIEHPPMRQTRAQRRLAKQYLAPLKAAVAAKAWVQPIKNCTATVQRHGANFVLPQPVAFNATHVKGLPKGQPPAEALTEPPPPPLSPPAATNTP